MRVLVVTVVHDPQDARIRHRQIAALLDAGHDVVLAAPFSGYRRPLSHRPAGVDLPRARGRSRLAALRAARALLRRSARAYDLVVLHDPELLLALPGLGRAVRRRVVWDVHEDTAAALSLKSWLPEGLRPLVVRAVVLAERWAERSVRLMLAEESYAARFRRAHPVVPNSVVVPAAEPPPPGDSRLVYVGALSRARGALDMVEVGRRLGSEVTVALVGPADRAVEPVLRAAHAEGVVVWHGFLPNDEALRLVDGALAGLSLLHDEPNYAHSRPTKIMEYMAHGVPVITTPNPASVALVERHGCGVVVPYGDVDAVVEAVRRLRAGAAERRAMGAAGRAAAVSAYSWSVDGPRLVEVLESWAGEG